MTRFDITFKKKRGIFNRKQGVSTTTVYGDNYFISDKDSSGFSRFVIIEHGVDREKTHRFVCNSHDILYVHMKPNYERYEAE